MKKYLSMLLLFLPELLSAQISLAFDQSLLVSEDKWIALPMNKDSVYTFGFVYLDEVAGLTFHLGGTFKEEGGKFIPKKQPETAMMKQRISPNPVRVAHIPAERFSELQIAQYPEWLKYYKHEENNVNRLFRLGSTYNAWNEPVKALTYLEQVKQRDPAYRGLYFEMAFSYNVLKQFDKAIQISEEGIKKNPKDCNLYKELLFAQMHLGNIEKAEKTYQAALTQCSNKEINAEMAGNIASFYFNKKNKEKINYWIVETRKWVDKESRNAKYLDYMEEQAGKL